MIIVKICYRSGRKTEVSPGRYRGQVEFINEWTNRRTPVLPRRLRLRNPRRLRRGEATIFTAITLRLAMRPRHRPRRLLLDMPRPQRQNSETPTRSSRRRIAAHAGHTRDLRAARALNCRRAISRRRTAHSAPKEANCRMLPHPNADARMTPAISAMTTIGFSREKKNMTR